jgi:hypothetical protein
MYKTLLILVAMFGMMTFPVSASPISPENLRFVVVDSSHEKYGGELKKDVILKLDKQMPGCEIGSNDLKATTLEQLQLGDRQYLSTLAKDLGTNSILTVEILPVKSDYSDLLYYKNIKTVATLRVRLYNAVTKQYTLTEDVIGRGSNTTYLPYTSIGKKPPVKEAVRKATDAGSQKINQSLAEVINTK